MNKHWGLLFMLLTIFFSCINKEKEVTINATITYITNFDPILPKSCNFYLWGGKDSIDGIKMNNAGDTFTYNLVLDKNTEYIMNINVFKNLSCSNDNIDEYVVSNRGIRAKGLKINNIIIDNTYIKYDDNGYTNIIFYVDSHGNIIPGFKPNVQINSNIPAEVYHITQKINMNSNQIRGKYANAWYSVIHDTSKGGDSKVEINSLSLYATLSNGDNILIGNDLYETRWEGKLYVRYPYYLCSLDPALQWPMPAQITDNKLVFYPSSNTKRINLL